MHGEVLNLNHTIHSRPGKRRILSDNLGFSEGMQKSDNGTASFIEGVAQ